MATANDTAAREIPDWLETRSSRILGPSWLMSVATHVLLAWLVWQLAQSPGCQARRGEQIVEDGREVGIFVRERGPEDPADAGGSPPTPVAPAQAAAVANSAAASQSPPVSNRPPVELSLPAPTLPPAIGMGPVPAFATQAAAAAGGPLVQNSSLAARGDSGMGTGSRSGSGAGKGTSMYGIPAKGSRFVYAIDRSSSMTDVLLSAKSELMASLRRLDSDQEFQVIFFNNEPRELHSRFAMFHGTESDRQMVEDQLPAFTAANGTNRLAALKAALDHGPDVVYFLTDSEDPMSAAELDDIRRRSRGGVQINCVEFGVGPAVTDQNGQQVKNFLHKLAAQSGGGYTYVNIARGALR